MLTTSTCRKPRASTGPGQYRSFASTRQVSVSPGAPDSPAACAALTNRVTQTGTLTTDNLNFEKIILPPSTGSADLAKESLLMCREVMAVCHSLSLVDGQPSGDPLEVELLRASGWRLHESSQSGFMEAEAPDGSSQRNVIVKHFEFSSDKLRAGTLMQRSTGEVLYLLKGSPEIISKIVDQNSFSVSDMERSLSELAKQGSARTHTHASLPPTAPTRPPPLLSLDCISRVSSLSGKACGF